MSTRRNQKTMNAFFSIFIMIIVATFCTCKSKDEKAGGEKIGVIESVIKSKKSALEVAGEFVKAGLNGDFKKLAELSCKDDGPYMTFEEAKHLDIRNLGLIEKIVREEKSKVDPNNLKIVVARLNVQRKVEFQCFIVFNTPKGNKIYYGAPIEYPVEEDMLAKTALGFYHTNKYNISKAAEIAKNIVNSEPDNLDALYRLGHIYSLMGRKEDALTQYKIIIVEDSSYAKNKLPKDDFLLACEGLLSHPEKWVRYYAAEELFNARKDEKAIPIMIEIWTERLESFKNTDEKGQRRYSQEQYREWLNNGIVRMLASYRGSASTLLLIDILEICHKRAVIFDIPHATPSIEWHFGLEIIPILGELKDEKAIPVLLKGIEMIPEKFREAKGEWTIDQRNAEINAWSSWVNKLSSSLIMLNTNGVFSDLKEVAISKIKKCILDCEFEWMQPLMATLESLTGERWTNINCDLVNAVYKSIPQKENISKYGIQNWFNSEYKGRIVINEANLDEIRGWYLSDFLGGWRILDFDYDAENNNFILLIWIQVQIDTEKRGMFGQIITKAVEEHALISLKPKGQMIELYNIKKVPLDIKRISTGVTKERSKEALEKIEPEARGGEVLPPVRAIGDIKPPRLIKKVEPIYPEIARQAGIEGKVIVDATIDIYGRVQSVKVLRSIPILDQAAIDAVSQYVYEPVIIDGKPRGVIFNITVEFKLK